MAEADERVQETLSSGVVVTILPFPARLFLNLQRRAEEKFPDPVVPKKTIEVVDGTEEVDDFGNAEYKAELAEQEDNRASWMSEKVLDTLLKFCTEIDLADYENIISELEDTLWEFPKDQLNRKIEFINNYGARTKNDFNLMILRSLQQTTVDDAEVDARLKSFQSNLEESTT